MYKSIDEIPPIILDGVSVPFNAGAIMKEQISFVPSPVLFNGGIVSSFEELIEITSSETISKFKEHYKEFRRKHYNELCNKYDETFLMKML